MEPIWAISILENGVSNLLQQSHPVYSTDIQVVAPLRIDAGKGAEEQLAEEREEVWCAFCLCSWLIRECVSGRSVGDLSELGVRKNEFFVVCFLQNCLQTLEDFTCLIILKSMYLQEEPSHHCGVSQQLE